MCFDEWGSYPRARRRERSQANWKAVRVVAGEPELPAGVTAEDGLTQDEAVAIALWNSPTFLVNLADLGIARADVAQAGLLRNPVFSLLLPWGPKQLEATLRWPIDALWQRPRRLAAARVSADASRSVGLFTSTVLNVLLLPALYERWGSTASN